MLLFLIAKFSTTTNGDIAKFFKDQNVLQIKKEFICCYKKQLHASSVTEAFMIINKSIQIHIFTIIFNTLTVHMLRSAIDWISYLPTPPLGQDMTQGQFLSGV